MFFQAGSFAYNIYFAKIAYNINL